MPNLTTPRQSPRLSSSPPSSFPRSSAPALAALLAVAGCGGCAGSGDGTTFVLVHGSWMGAAGWSAVADRLRAEDAEVRAIDLPAHGLDPARPSDATLDAYVDRVSAEIDAAGPPVILVGHSMAGVVISQLAERRPRDLTALVYVAAYLPAHGQSLLELASTDADSQVGPAIVAHPDGTIDLQPELFPDLFCADCDPAGRAALVAGYRVEPGAPLATKVALTPGAFGAVAKTYIRTSRDRVVSPSLQSRMVAASAVRRDRTLDTGHVPMLSAPAALAKLLLE